MSHAIAVRPFNAPDPVACFARLRSQPGVFWLDSSLQRPEDGRFSIMGAHPRWVLSGGADGWTRQSAGGGVGQGANDVLYELDRVLAENAAGLPPAGATLPFYGGLVGWLGYELGQSTARAHDDVGGAQRPPDLWLAWYDAAIVWDHAASTAWLVGTSGERAATDAIDALAGLLDAPADESILAGGAPEAARVVANSNLSRDEYLERVTAVREGIARGEYYQLNLVQRFRCAAPADPALAYLRLRSVNPAPFSAYVAAGATTVLGSSPERFLEISPAGTVRTCPIKGTRPRGDTPASDAAQREELLASAKERAELLMIVDLLRNDLGRVCQPGSIAVARLHAVESFATVHHLVGEVRGELRRGVAPSEWIRATFPGGSITGAPKVSAMNAIAQLEPDRRGIGMGALGYFSAHGRVDLAIAIRTITCTAGTAHIPVGAGIVWDSDPVHEYEETLLKARALFAALNAFPVAQ